MLRVGVIGVGYWGPNLIRNFVANPGTEMKMCCDLRRERLNYINSLYPTIEITENCKEIIESSEIDLIVICTPVFTHYEIAKKALEAGKHVLIEKPMTSTGAEGEELLNIAEQKGLQIFVDHTFIFTGAVAKIKELIDNEEVGVKCSCGMLTSNLVLAQTGKQVLDEKELYRAFGEASLA